MENVENNIEDNMQSIEKSKPLNSQLITKDKAFKISILSLILSLVALVVTFKSGNTSSLVGMIDMNSLISEHAVHLAKSHHKSKVSDRVLQESVAALKEHIITFGKEKGVVLVNKNAVLSSDFKDYTDDLKSSLQG
jgi:hypothetical protein